MLCAITFPAFAQIDTEIQTAIPTPLFSTVRSSIFTASEGDIIVVKVNGPEQLSIEASIYDDRHMLVAKEDPEEQRAEFQYIVAVTGSYYVVGRNISAVDGTFSVFIRQGAKAEPVRGKPLAVVRVFYATNRAPAKDARLSPYYLNEPASTADYAAGSCYVRIPPNHKLGELESLSTFQLTVFRDPGTDIRITKLEPEDNRSKFFQAIHDKANETVDKQVLVFIHGFNVAFEDAARRAAQISYDLAFAGATVLFSWPSNASPVAYKKDQARADASVEVLERFLRDLPLGAGTTNIHIIAHSMGNRVLTQALERLAEDPATPRFRNAIMVAPDINASTLAQIAGIIHQTASRITLYASTKDLALKLSELNGSPPRAGNHISYSTDLETIDASAANTELTAWSHSYFADSPLVLGDLFHLLRGEPPGMRFALDRICAVTDCADGRVYWRFRPSAVR